MKDVLGGALMLILALALVSGAVIYVAGGGDGRWEFETRIVIDATRDDLEVWLTEPERRVKWVQGLTGSQLLDAQRVVQGSRLRETARIEGENQERAVEVVTFDPGQKIEFLSTAPGLIMREEFLLTGTARKTHVLYRCEISQEGLGFLLLEPLFSAGVDARLRKSLETLKTLAEGPF